MVLVARTQAYKVSRPCVLSGSPEAFAAYCPRSSESLHYLYTPRIGVSVLPSGSGHVRSSAMRRCACRKDQTT